MTCMPCPEVLFLLHERTCREIGGPMPLLRSRTVAAWDLFPGPLMRRLGAVGKAATSPPAEHVNTAVELRASAVSGTLQCPVPNGGLAPEQQNGLLCRMGRKFAILTRIIP